MRCGHPCENRGRPHILHCGRVEVTSQPSRDGPGVLAMRIPAFILFLLLSSAVPAHGQEYFGQRSTSPYASGSLSNSYGAGQSYGQSRFFGDRKASVGLLRQDTWRPFRQFKNTYNPNATTHPYGRYGSRSSPNISSDSYGTGSPYSSDRPFKPYSKGLRVDGE